MFKKFNNLLSYLSKGAKFGFSLAEMAIIVAVASALTIGSLAWVKPEVKDSSFELKITTMRMDAIEKALQQFVLREGRLPCPANPTLPSTSLATFNDYIGGTSLRSSMHYADEYLKIIAGSPGFGDTYTCNFSADGVPISSTVYPSQIGSVPTKALGLPSEYMLDGWGRKMRYQVSPDLCGSNGCNRRTFQDPTHTGSLLVYNVQVANNQNTPFTDVSTHTNYGAYTLVASGPEGYNSYDIDGNKISDGKSSDREIANSFVPQPGWENLWMTSTPGNGLPTWTDFKTPGNNSASNGFVRQEIRYKNKEDLLQNGYSDLSLLISYSDCTNAQGYLRALIGPHFAPATSSSAPADSLNPSNSWGGFRPLVGISGDPDFNIRPGEAVVDILWSLQEVCFAIHGFQFGRACPNFSGTVYNDQTIFPCNCNNGNWNGAC